MQISVIMNADILSIYSDLIPDKEDSVLKAWSDFFLSKGILYSTCFKRGEDLWGGLASLVDYNLSAHDAPYQLFEFILNKLTRHQQVDLIDFLKQQPVSWVEKEPLALTLSTVSMSDKLTRCSF